MSAPVMAQVTPQRLLENDGYTIDKYRAGETPAQDAQPLRNQRGTGLDGSLRLQAPFGWVVNANPFHEEWNDHAWYLGEIMLNTGRYSPTEIDMALPAPGFRWTVGRTYNIPGDPDLPSEPNSGSHRTEGYQGYNWQQFSQPELVYVTGPEDEDYIYIVYGADRYLTFRQLEENSPVFRGVNGAAGAVVAGSSGDHGLFVYWDQHGTRSTFFDPRDPDNLVEVGLLEHNGKGQLWTIEDAAGNKAYVGDATDPADAIEAGYDDGGRIQVAFDTAGRKYEYTYEELEEDFPGTGEGIFLTGVEAFVPDGLGGWDTTGAKVEYAYAPHLVNGFHSFGDLMSVAITTPMTGFDPEDLTPKTATLHREYYYYATTASLPNFGHNHWIRAVFSPEGVRNYSAEYSDRPSERILNDSQFVEFAFVYYDINDDWTGRLETISHPGIRPLWHHLATYSLSYEDYSTFTSSTISPAYDPGHAFIVKVTPSESVDTGGVRFQQYFDEAGQPVSYVENPNEMGVLGCEGTSPRKWTYVSRRAVDTDNGVDGVINLIATPMAIESGELNPPLVSGYEPPCEIKVATAGTNGQLVHVFDRITATASPFYGFLASHSWQNGASPSEPEDGPFPFVEYAYLDPVENEAAAATVGGEYLVVRPLYESITLIPDIDFSNATYSEETTSFQYEFHAEDVGGGGTGLLAGDPMWLTPRRITAELPAVPTGQYGSGNPAYTETYYRPDGTIVYIRDEVGSFTYRAVQGGLNTKLISDADLASTSDFLSGEAPADYIDSPPSTSGAFHLISGWSYDSIGRATEFVLPTGRVRQAHYSVFESGEWYEVWSAASDTGTHSGPADFRVYDQNFNEIIRATIALSPNGTTTTDLADWIDESALHPLQSLDVGEFGQIQAAVMDRSGRVVLADRVYTSSPISGEGARSYNYDERLYEYGGNLRTVGLAEYTGTLRVARFDQYGNELLKYVDGYDPREGVTPPIGGGGGPGPSIVPGMDLKPGERCCDQVMSFYGHPFASICGRSMPVFGIGSGFEQGEWFTQCDILGNLVFEYHAEAPHVFREYDNAGRLVAEGLYGEVPGFTIRSLSEIRGGCSPDDPNIFLPHDVEDEEEELLSIGFDDRFHTPRTVASGRVSLVEYEYNPRGQVAKVRRYSIEGNGEIEQDGSSNPVYTETVYGYDAAGRLVYVNDGRGTRIVRDRLGREVSRYTEFVSGGSIQDGVVISPSSHIVYERTQLVRDPATGNVTFEIVVERPHAGALGELDTNNYSNAGSFTVSGSNLKGRAQITEYVYDSLDRVVERRVHGTGGTDTGGTFNPASPPPGALVTSLTRDPAGRVAEVEDALGRVQKREYDLADNLTEVIDNYDSGVTGTTTDDVNRRTRYVYLHTQLVSFIAYTDPSDENVFQETKYFYDDGIDNEAPDDPSRDRLLRILYPDNESEIFTYNIYGARTSFTNRDGAVFTSDLDNRYRAQSIRYPGGSLGGAVEIGYDGRGEIESLTQTITDSSGNYEHDKVVFEYDTYGALSRIGQSQKWMGESVVSGRGLGLTAMAAETPSVEYVWQRSTTASTGPSRLHLSTVTYPDSKVLTHNYIGNDHGFSRVTNLNFDGANVAAYQYLGVDRPEQTTYPENSVFSTLRSAPGVYDALDRFNRPVRSRWNRTRGSNQVPFYDTTVHWDAGSNVTGVTDHVFGEFSFVYANDALDRLVGARRGTGSGVSITGLIEQEDWVLGKVGNWTGHKLELTGDDPPSYSTDPADGEFQAVAQFSDLNETVLIKRDRDNDGLYTGTGETVTRVYDSNGNLVSDPEKGHAYTWDVLGRLMEIRDGGNALVAEFRYNALGHRIAERIAAEGADWTRLVYDARWRVVATYRIDVSEEEEALRERFVYHAAGLDGVGTGSYIDALVLRDRDADGNGSLEERHYYAQSWRHDVVAIIDHQGRQVEHMRYTPYGVPISIPASDTNRDGVLDSDDLTLQAAAISGPYSVVHDLDLDGDVDFTDLSLAVNQIGAITNPIGRGVLSSYGHRAGYAGYRWMPAAGLYHVRYRWYDPLNGTWISKDPAGYVDGASLFGYLAQQPIPKFDPTGLDPRVIPVPFDETGSGPLPWATPEEEARWVREAQKNTLIIVTVIVVVNVPDPTDIVTVPLTRLVLKKLGQVGARCLSKLGRVPPKTGGVPKPPANPNNPPGPDWEWRGNESPDSGRGSWYNPHTDESLHPDLNHGPPIGPHWDYIDPSGNRWRIFPDGRIDAK